MNNINALRTEIDSLDNELIDILSRRFEVTRKIGLYKKTNNLDSVDEKRLDEMICRLEKLAKGRNVDQKLIREIILTIHQYVVSEHEQTV